MFEKVQNLGRSKVKNAASLGLEIDKLTQSFTTIITSLKEKSAEADSLRKAKEEEIAILQTECNNLSEVSTRATNLADKISNIFN